MNNSKYWQWRINDKLYNKNTAQLNKELLKLYKQANKDIQKDIADLYIKMLNDGGINSNNLYAYGRYTDLQGNIDKHIQKLGIEEVKATQLNLIDAYKQSYITTNNGLGVKTSWNILNENFAKQIINTNYKGSNFSSRIWNNKSKLSTQIKKSITDTVITGKDKDKAVKIIMDKFNVAFSDADRIVRTETMRVLNEGQRQSYKDSGYDKVEWLAEEDDRICEDCESLNGKIYNIDDTPDLPLHPNCRCTLLPLIE